MDLVSSNTERLVFRHRRPLMAALALIGAPVALYIGAFPPGPRSLAWTGWLWLGVGTGLALLGAYGLSMSRQLIFDRKTGSILLVSHGALHHREQALPLDPETSIAMVEQDFGSAKRTAIGRQVVLAHGAEKLVVEDFRGESATQILFDEIRGWLDGEPEAQSEAGA